MAFWGAEQVTVRESSIHGAGVFATRDFHRGDLILIRDETREVTPAHPLLEHLGEHEWHCDWLEGGRRVLLPSPERHVNDSCEPNSFVRRIDGAGHNFALRNISAGEEITHSYSVNLTGGEAWDCHCGAPTAFDAYRATSSRSPSTARSSSCPGSPSGSSRSTARHTRSCALGRNDSPRS